MNPTNRSIVVLCRTLNDNNLPEFNKETLSGTFPYAEYGNALEAALLWAQEHLEAGYWVDVYEELFYGVPQ